MDATFFSTEPLYITLLSILGAMTFIQLFYYFRYFRRAAFYRRPDQKELTETPPVTVIICAQNEADNLREYLPSVLEQNYPSFEVLVVNDCSDDDSADILKLMMKKYNNLKVSTIQPDLHFSHSKQLPMLIGIKAASNDLLVFTDAFSRPSSENWLKAVVTGYNKGADMIIGYGSYQKEKGLLNRYIRFETMFTAMNYLGKALCGRAYMGVGRNIAYRRSFFFEKGGFGPYNHIHSGGDDLFINRNSTKTNTYAMLEQGSSTVSVPVSSFRLWMRFKHTHYIISRYYRNSDKFRLFFEPMSRMIYYGLLIFFLITLISWPVVAGIALLRLIVRIVILKKSTRTFNEKGIFVFSLFFDILQPLFNSVIYIKNSRKAIGDKKWN